MSARQEAYVTHEAADLFALLASPFEDDFDYRQYSATFTLPVSAECNAVLSRFVMGQIRDLTGRVVERGSPWDASIGYDAETDAVGIQELSLPLHSPSQRERLVLRHLHEGTFLALYQTAGGSFEPVLTPDNRSSVFMRSPDVTRLLADGGHRLPETCSDPIAMKLALTGLHDRAITWSQTERRIIREDVFSQTTIERQHTKKTAGDRDTYLTDLRTHSEELSDDGRTRDQLDVTMVMADYDLESVEVSRRQLEPSSEQLEIITDENWAVTASREYRVTPRLIRLLTSIYLDALYDAKTAFMRRTPEDEASSLTILKRLPPSNNSSV